MPTRCFKGVHVRSRFRLGSLQQHSTAGSSITRLSRACIGMEGGGQQPTEARSSLSKLQDFASNCDNTLVRTLTQEPLSPEKARRPREVKGAHFTHVSPEPVPSPYLVGASESCAELLGLDPSELQSDKFVKVFSGNDLIDGLQGWATVYGCHCGGQWFGQLGDGRAMSIGEAVNPSTGQRQEMQLKGCGRTPYSRQFDGRAVLRSSIREFLASEHMSSLGVETTRALCVIGHDEQIQRAWYPDSKDRRFAGSGQEQAHPPHHLKVEPGAVLCRVSPSFIRFAQLELFWKRGETSLLVALADHALEREFPEIKKRVQAHTSQVGGDDQKESERGGDGGLAKADGYVSMFRQIVSRQALLVAEWLRVGYVQGNMNSDNTLIGGRTLDYGPFGFMEKYDPLWTPFTSDPVSNFGFRNQPRAALVNVAVLSGAFKALIDALRLPEQETASFKQQLDDAVQGFGQEFQGKHYENCRRKLGLQRFDDEAQQVWQGLEALMTSSEVDYTLMFTQLTRIATGQDDLPTVEEAYEILSDAFYTKPSSKPEVLGWKQWIARYFDSLSKDDRNLDDRKREMQRANPSVILRNWMATVAYEAAERQDTSVVQQLHEVLSDPYHTSDEVNKKWAQKTPEWARGMPGVAFMS